MQKEKIKNNLSKLTLPALGVVSGGAIGTIDVLTSGYPLLSGYLEVSALFNFFSAVDSRNNFFDVSYNESVVAHLSYLTGVAIPFAIKYKEEISSFLEGVLR
jgi:hypothetical protein